MIYINLLPTKNEFKKNVFFLQMGILVVLCLLSTAAYFLIMDISINKKIEHEDQYTTRLNTKIKALDSVITKVEGFKKQKAELERKISTIEQLNRQRTGPVFFMEEFSELLPDKVWVLSFKETGKKLSIDGFAMDGPTLEEFVDLLIESPYFTNVVLEKVDQSIEGQKELQKFSITSNVNYTPKGA
jgi:type IV pilus assembly protein PilN